MRRAARPLGREPSAHHLSAEEAEGPDTFYEAMFYNFAEDPYDSDCTYTYWSDGIAIERSW